MKIVLDNLCYLWYNVIIKMREVKMEIKYDFKNVDMDTIVRYIEFLKQKLLIDVQELARKQLEEGKHGDYKITTNKK
ncbi:hypothetical protein CCP1ISM_10440001 [Azospirillaceae bacterium]